MRNWIIGSLVVAVTALAVLFVATAPSDEDLVREAIEESARASREGRPGGVLEYLSRSITFNDVPMLDRNEIAKYVRLAKPEVTFGPYDPVIDGDHAVVVADVTVKMNFQGANLDQTFRGVQLRLAKETGTRWVVLPGTRWRIAEVEAPGLDQFGESVP